MKIAERMARLLRADAHGVMDALEERSLLLRQHLREAELALDRSRARCQALEERERKLGEEAARIEAESVRLDEDLELALTGGDAGEDDSLARFAAGRLLPVKRAGEALALERGELAVELERMQELVRTRECELAALSRRVQTALAREPERRADGVASAGPAVSEEEIDLELLRRRRARTGEVQS